MCSTKEHIHAWLMMQRLLPLHLTNPTVIITFDFAELCDQVCSCWPVQLCLWSGALVCCFGLSVLLAKHDARTWVVRSTAGTGGHLAWPGWAPWLAWVATLAGLGGHLGWPGGAH